ncbi:putative histone deacetylase complex subunit SAP30/SAP30 [Helianthus annuus]|nr:putative histone deacetylase complex subunit SAP30/SAP30 [Helianthus annuus]
MDQTYVNNNNGGGTGGDQEELSVLPRHTKVVVTGNNRTKSVLVGLHGVVKKAVGLGGWHWLVGQQNQSRALPGHPLDQTEYSESNPSPRPIPGKTR